MTTDFATSKLTGDHRRYSRIGFLSVATVFFGFGAFAYHAPLDSAAIAPGRVAAESSTKPIQHLEGGIIREIFVKESAKVKAGDVLFRLEPTQALASSDMLKKQLDAALAQEARLTAERDLASNVAFPASLNDRRSVPEAAAAVLDQTQQFQERRISLLNQMMIQKSRMEQAVQEIAGLRQQEVALKEQTASLGSEIASVSGLAKKGFYPRTKLMALEREDSRIKGQLGAAEGEIAQKSAAVEEAKIQIRQAEQTYREKASGELADVRNRISDLGEKLKVAADVVTRTDIKAPQDGIVQGIKVHVAGAVVRPGDIVAELVPTGDKLVMAARVSPLDIDDVMPGQTAEVRFASFTARQLPIILGTVESIGADSMMDEITRQPYYTAKVVVDPSSVPASVAERLMPGMPADVVIATGERTLLEYLGSPIANLFATSMREK